MIILWLRIKNDTIHQVTLVFLHVNQNYLFDALITLSCYYSFNCSWLIK